MHGTGSYLAGTSASADYFPTVDQLLYKLPDNTANLIKAKDVRDSVFTLWHRLDEVSIIAGSAASASAFFQNPNPTPYDVGGITAGSTFPAPHDMQTMWDLLLYPYVAPGPSLTGGGDREFGGPLNVTLNWSVTKNTNPITSITVDGMSIVPTGNNQSGLKLASGTHSVIPGVSESNYFNMSVSDGVNTEVDDTALNWMNRIYWGTLDLLFIGNPNLTLNPGLSASVSALINSSTLLSLSGGGVGTGSELSTTKSKQYDGIDGGGNYLIFAWPSNLSGATTPNFTVNGLQNTAFTKVKTSWLFTNQFGFSTNYEVWVSNTLQNSPLFIEIS